MTAGVQLGGPHWDFSLALYAEPAISGICLELQNKSNVDVNVLLLVAWAAANGRQLDMADVERLDIEVRDWRKDVIVPLRETRTRLKSILQTSKDRMGIQELRESVKGAELTAEQIEQAIIASWLLVNAKSRAPHDRVAVEQVAQAISSVVLYFRGPDRHAIPHGDEQKLEVIAAAACRQIQS